MWDAYMWGDNGVNPASSAKQWLLGVSRRPGSHFVSTCIYCIRYGDPLSCFYLERGSHHRSQERRSVVFQWWNLAMLLGSGTGCPSPDLTLKQSSAMHRQPPSLGLLWKKLICVGKRRAIVHPRWLGYQQNTLEIFYLQISCADMLYICVILKSITALSSFIPFWIYFPGTFQQTQKALVMNSYCFLQGSSLETSSTQTETLQVLLLGFLQRGSLLWFGSQRVFLTASISFL